MTTTQQPYEILHRFDGSQWHVSAKVRTVYDDGTFRDGDAVPITGQISPVFEAIRNRVNEFVGNNLHSAVLAQVSQLQADLAAANTAKDEAVTAKQQAESQVATLQARISELEAQLNPPNPFPNADWQGFRSAALASPIVLRMATSNMGNFMMLLIYMTEMQKDPAAVAKMAGVWNEMEGKTPLSPEEITAINALAQAHSVPMVLNSEGQIVLP